MLMGVLLIHLSGGRIETHFHVFGSLAFLALYRDWRVLVTATIIVAVDHFFRGLYWPRSVYGIMTSSPWRWAEHAGWVVFEDVVLVSCCLQSLRELRALAFRQAEVESAHIAVEGLVRERTADLTRANADLTRQADELRAAEEVARERQRFVESLAKANPSLTYLFDIKEDRIVWSNHRASSLLGYSAGEVEAKGHEAIIADHIHPDDAGRLALYGVDRLFEQSGDSQIQELELRFRHANGSWRWLSSRNMVFRRDESGRPLHILGTADDITERKRHEEALTRARAQLIDTIESLDSGLAMYGPDGRLVVCNQRYRQLFSSCAELISPGTKYEKILRESYRTDGYQATRLTEDEWVTQALEPFRLRRGAYEEESGGLWNRIAKFPASDGGVVSLRTDITEIKRTQQELLLAKEAAEAASRAKSAFLANMSHEIRTPMNGILGMTELALETQLTPRQREYLTVVKNSADSLVNVINDILDFSKIEAGKMKLDWVRFSLRDALDETLQTLAIRAHSKGLELACRITPDVPDALVGDAGRLRQVLVNLIGNAIKFTEKGEVILVGGLEELRGEEVVLRFAVADTGIGIPLEKLRTIFQPFEQADTSTTRRFGGTGLGLTISAKLVELMGGEIWVESRQGIGSTFWFTVVQGVQPDDVVGPGEPSFPRLEGLPVLIVDDNATNRLILVDMLSNWGARPIAVDCAPAALDALRSAASRGQPFPIALVDGMMPDIDGLALAECIRREPEIAGVHLLLLTSAGHPEETSRYQALEISAYLTKPVKQSELFNGMMKALASRATSDESQTECHETQERPDPIPADGGLRILVAEDHPVNQKVAVRMLEHLGHSVVVAPDGRMALAVLEAGEFDLVLMDLQMPEMDGFEAVRMIRAREATTGKHVPILALTAHAMQGDRERCLQSGFDGYLAKPIRQADLQKALEVLGHNTLDTLEGNHPVLAALNATCRGDQEFARELAESFLESSTRCVAAIEDALRAGDSRALAVQAHALNGSSRTIGADDLAAASAAMEYAGRRVDLEAAAATATRLTGAWEVVRTALEQLLVTGIQK
jgi:PAS domain S-box-containing protein